MTRKAKHKHHAKPHQGHEGLQHRERHQPVRIAFDNHIPARMQQGGKKNSDENGKSQDHSFIEGS